MLVLRPETGFCIVNDIVLKTIPVTDQYYAFNTLTGDHFILNHTAWWLLDRLRQPIIFSELESAYIDNFSVRRDVAIKHLKETMTFFMENELIKEVLL